MLYPFTPPCLFSFFVPVVRRIRKTEEGQERHQGNRWKGISRKAKKSGAPFDKNIIIETSESSDRKPPGRPPPCVGVLYHEHSSEGYTSKIGRTRARRANQHASKAARVAAVQIVNRPGGADWFR